MTAEYQQTAEQVVRTLGSDAGAWPVDAEARTRLAHVRPESAGGRTSGAAWRKFLAQFRDVLVDPAADRHGDFDRAVVVRTGRRAAVRSDRDQRGRAAECDPRLRPAGASRIRDRGAPPDGGRPRARDSRRRADERSCRRSRARRRPRRRGRRHRAADARVIESTALQRRRSGSHRRESAGVEGHRPHTRRGRPRRSHQHDLQRDVGHLWPWAGGSDRDRHADRDGAHRRHAVARAERTDAAPEGARSRRQAARRGGRLVSPS